MGDQLIRDYYRAFNERRSDDASALFASDAVLKTPAFVQATRGPNAYLQFVQGWLRAFPDAQFTIHHVEQRGDTICEVDGVATGTHRGRLDLGTFGLLAPGGARLTLPLTELLEVRCGLITYASLAFNLKDLVRQLTSLGHEGEST